MEWRERKGRKEGDRGRDRGAVRLNPAGGCLQCSQADQRSAGRAAMGRTGGTCQRSLAVGVRMSSQKGTASLNFISLILGEGGPKPRIWAICDDASYSSGPRAVGSRRRGMGSTGWDPFAQLACLRRSCFAGSRQKTLGDEQSFCVGDPTGSTAPDKSVVYGDRPRAAAK